MEIYQYLRKLHTFVEYQEKKINKMDRTVKKLQDELSRLKERPPVQVGKIEYKFDQLKVETLEGTLNIGLNPADLEGISDFSVDNKNIHAPLSPKDQFMRSMEIENEIGEYLETSLQDIYQTTQSKLNFTVDDTYYSFIKEDISKQLPNRITSHLNELPPEDREDNNNAKQKVVEKLKNEIQHGVFLFLNSLKEQQGV